MRLIMSLILCGQSQLKWWRVGAYHKCFGKQIYILSVTAKSTFLNVSLKTLLKDVSGSKYLLKSTIMGSIPYESALEFLGEERKRTLNSKNLSQSYFLIISFDNLFVNVISKHISLRKSFISFKFSFQ